LWIFADSVALKCFIPKKTHVLHLGMTLPEIGNPINRPPGFPAPMDFFNYLAVIVPDEGCSRKASFPLM
jgi:hypothetical protein